jgi:hypothetical protein
MPPGASDSAGYAMHLSKPVGIPELLAAIAQLAGQGTKIVV